MASHIVLRAGALSNRGRTAFFRTPALPHTAIETFVLSFGFAYRFNYINKEKRNLLFQINKQQYEVTQQIIVTQETERKRIAEDLHDELGGDLAAIKINMQSLDGSISADTTKIGQLLKMIDKASENVRRIAHNLMPAEFNETKLSDLLAAHLNGLNGESGYRFQFNVSGEDNRFNKQQELFIYRIILELSNNIIRHAAATEASIQLLYYEAYLEIMVEDNGIGFSGSYDQGIGLSSIKSRVSYLHGNMEIDSGKYGTTILIKIPYSHSHTDGINQNNNRR